jgi:hypothetical protein
MKQNSLNQLRLTLPQGGVMVFNATLNNIQLRTALCVGKHPDLSTCGGVFPLRLTNLDVSLHRGP